MKVLMLGWEFPPHISGGLGTACAGLTQALEKEQIEILFVVPKLHGGESVEKTTLISASTIPILQKKSIIEEDVFFEPSLKRGDQRLKTALPTHFIKTSIAGNRTTFGVSSFLAPYNSPEVNEVGLRQWNYSFSKENTLSMHARIFPAQRDAEGKVRYTKEPFEFTGAYGSGLMEEVDRYAEVASIIASNNSFDLIHAHDWMTFRAGITAKKMSGKPLVVHVHATEMDRTGSNANRRVYEIEKEGMMLADKVVAVSNWTKNIAIKYYQVPEEKIEVVHNGINPNNIGEPKPAPPPVGSQIITFLGRITHQKGPMYFVEAARKVTEKFPEAHFVVAGSGDQLPVMIERIAQMRLSGKFHFTGFLKGDEINKIWAMSTVYVMPSVSEPFGIAPLEAIQAGVPVIISKQAGVSEVMPHAIKVDFWDTNAFAEAICNLLRFKSLTNTLRKNGAEEIKTITWDKAAKKLTTLYHELRNKQEKRQKSDSLFPGTPAKKTPHATFL